MLHIKFKGMTIAKTYNHIFCPFTHPRPLGRDQRSKQLFSVRSHIAYQVHGNGAYSTVQAHIMVRTIFYENSHVAYQVKVNEQRAPVVHSQPPDGVKRSKHVFLTVDMLHIKLKGLEHREPCKYSVRTHTLDPTYGVKGQNIFFFCK